MASVTLGSEFDVVSAPVTFRVYFYGAGTTDTTNTNDVLRLDKFLLTGTVPEPASMGLMGLATCGFLAHRRRANRT